MASKEVAATLERIAAAEARIAAVEAERAKRIAAAAPWSAKRDAHRKRSARVVMTTTAGGWNGNVEGDHRMLTLDHVTVGYGGGNLPEKELAEAIAAGQVKVNAGGGVELTARGLVQRSRTPSPNNLRALTRALAARTRAEQALARAQKVVRDVRAETHEAGERIALEVLAAAVARAAVLARKARVEPVGDDYDAVRDLERAKQHLAWLKAKNPDKGACPCQPCAMDRAEVIRRRDRAAALAELPAKLHACPLHGKREKMRSEIVSESFRADSFKADTLPPEIAAIPYDYYRQRAVPYLWCVAEQKRMLDVGTFLVMLAREAKAAAKGQPKAKGKEWLCPATECGEVNDVVADELANGVLICGTCGAELPAESIRLYKRGELEREAA